MSNAKFVMAGKPVEVDGGWQIGLRLSYGDIELHEHRADYLFPSYAAADAVLNSILETCKEWATAMVFLQLVIDQQGEQQP